jgi:hypothetical protein
MGNAASEPRDVEVVRAAATRSLGMTGVRLYRATISETPSGWAEPWSWEIGVANPAARSAQLRHYYAEDSPLEKLGEAVVRRWPWLDDDGSAHGQGPRAGEETIEINRAQYYGGPERWIDWSDLSYYGPGRALWPLEAILDVTTATGGESIDVRGTLCARYLTHVVPDNRRCLGDARLVDPPLRHDDWRELTADVCIDDQGHVRRIAWSPNIGKRPRPGLLARLAVRLDKDPDADHAINPPGRPWHVTELWDYGCNVEIHAPTNLIDAMGTPIRDIAIDLWRMRRRYQQRHR